MSAVINFFNVKSSGAKAEPATNAETDVLYAARAINGHSELESNTTRDVEVEHVESEIPLDYAVPCIREYKDLKPVLGSAYTEGVSLNGPGLLTWINNLGTKALFDEIRLELAIYDADTIKAYALPAAYLGRITIFMAAYYKGSRAKATGTGAELPVYNIGHLNP